MADLYSFIVFCHYRLLI